MRSRRLELQKIPIGEALAESYRIYASQEETDGGNVRTGSGNRGPSQLRARVLPDSG